MFYNFYPSSWFHTFVRFLEEEVPVRYTSEKLAYVHKIEVLLGERPVESYIVDFEMAVGRNPFGLNWREVGADDSCARVRL